MSRFSFQFLLLNSIFIINLIFSEHLSITNSNINAGESASIDIHLDNIQEIAGFQFQIMDLPNQGDFIDAQSTERTSSFLINFN